AANGMEAVEKVQSRTYDVALMDIIMPKMDGVEAFRRIKEVNPEMAVILMTAYSDQSLIQTAKREGARYIIQKPIKIDRLIELITQLGGEQPIIIIDDDADICQSLTAVLEQQGYEVITALSGEEALALAMKRPCQIAFIDVKLPDIDGLETLLRLKEINPDILPIMMTGFRNEVKEALDKAQAASAITCLYKPFDPVEATEIVKKIGKKTRHHRGSHGRQQENPCR
ncbi:MAG: response regulator, partial [Dehalococcoidales bacterium]|nr:response regulator [Dehalococcoidales bacterium]